MIKFARLLTRILCLFLLVSSSALQAREFTMFFHNDMLGSPVLATDSTGKVLGRENYSPFGERQIKDPAASGNTLWFTGKPQNESSGLSYFGARYYSPELGQFMSVDPVAPITGNIHHFNRYAYANNNPSKYIDPDGQLPILVPIAIAVVAEIGNLALESYSDSGETCNGCIHPSGFGIPGGAIGSGAKVLGRTTTTLVDAAPSVTKGALKQFGRSIDDLSSAASQPFKNTGLTKAARALDKHAAGQRSSGTFPKLSGNAATRNKQAQQIVDDILGNSKSEFRTLGRGGLEVRSPSGQGVRFNKDGSFSGFVD